MKRLPAARAVGCQSKRKGMWLEASAASSRSSRDRKSSRYTCLKEGTCAPQIVMHQTIRSNGTLATVGR
jgi:hypothetical protein